MTEELIIPTTPDDPPMMDSNAACVVTAKMWGRLAQQFEGQSADAAAAGDPNRAIVLACCAEACFWKSTGEADSHDIKDVLPLTTGEPKEGENG